MQFFYESQKIHLSLGTQSRDIARMRRSELVEADDAYRAQLKLSLEKAEQTMDTVDARKRFEIAKAHAMAAGYTYRPVAQLADPSQIEDIVRQLLTVEQQTASDGRLNEAVFDAVFGGVSEPKTTVSEAMDIYKTKIALGELRSKSPAQKKLWHATKDRSLRNFVEVIGDRSISDITREHTQTYFDRWNQQLSPDDPDDKPKKPKTAARHFSDIRKLYAENFRYMGEEDRQNPFRNMNFKGKSRTVIPAFPDTWVRERILVRGARDGLTEELHLVTFMPIKTGCRPSEIINLRPEHIVLKAKVPHIAIRAREDRETRTSIREIPLVGVTLEAAKRAPGGFPRYVDKSKSFSAAMSAAFRRRELFPTADHVIYSFRHSFAKRMREANIDYALRCLLMGHKHDRQKFGDGGSLSYRRDEMMKIAHPVPKDLFADFDAARAA